MVLVLSALHLLGNATSPLVVEEGLLRRSLEQNHLHPRLNTLLDPMAPVLLQGGAGVEAVVAPLVVVEGEVQAEGRIRLVSLLGAEEGTPIQGAPLPARQQLLLKQGY